MRERLFCQEVFVYTPIPARTSPKSARRRALSAGTLETTATSAVAVLFALAGSELVLATLAELDTRPVVDGAVTMSVTVAEPDVVRLPMVQMTVVVPTHDP